MLAKPLNRALNQRIRDHLNAYLFISPFFILFAVFGVFPMIFTAWVSLHKWNIVGAKTFIGLQNYKFIMEDPYFWKSLYNTFSIWFLSTLPQLFFALILAFLLNQSMLKGREFFRISVFLPNITSVVAVAIIFGALFGQHYGLINYALSLLGMDPIDFRSSVLGTHLAISSMVMWRWTGYNAIIYLAGLQSIPNDLYEAATIDGATKRQQFFFITIPLLRPMIIFTIILSTIGGMQIFAEPLMFSGPGGGSQGQGLTITLLLYEEAFARQAFGYASAIAWMLFFIIVAFSLVNMFFAKKLQSAD
ncbi:cytochrome C biogenesis protein [Paenibacillus darwinianus]|uniref:Cytochrome C biogenesis protein n=1 Tax=Paenibacillus darwinianus TaxID=1380763 RepID=A0A9W5S0N3_9BACL|nr:sugar ABC transporter permease [Paenibacillus darwinianus]EXX87439.1 cytochrome C biogenesis protein [Paenibacillus darwinianus]EXX88139.1 cytochrome C biogenesis protein [Paenibacillus darwinianus]EXX88740.1 cytochrome C biogenesis protein [Paenibacillus darwinianus]